MEDERNLDGLATKMMLSRNDDTKTITDKDVAKALQLIQKYKDGKKNLEQRIVDDELWWELRHWEAIKNTSSASGKEMPNVTSAWLFNALLNKHADAMDNMPEPIVLPREESDKESAKILSDVLPVIMEYNGFDDTYSDNWWEKLKHGTACYGVFWDNEKENGLGDIDIKRIDLLNIFWEPGITDIQKSKNIFTVELIDKDDLTKAYPELNISGGETVDVKKYLYDDTVDTTNKAILVDWYYKTKIGGRTIVNYAKFCGNTLLYASENDPNYRETGYYEHGLYPFVFDVMFPEKGTPVGFGYVAICKEPQLYIDKLSSNILENAMMNTKKRFFASTSTNINKEQFLNWNEPIVEVEGELSDVRLQEIVCQPLSSVYLNVVNMKIEEMKDTAGNRDVNSGGTGAGVTSGAAIAALQEAGNKTSRDIISSAYRCYQKINMLVIELIRQFYDESRTYRIVSPNGSEYQFVDVSNANIKDQVIGQDAQGIELVRKPIFDLKIKAQKKNPFSRMEENERAKELFQLGFFNPELAEQALSALEMMNFEGIEEVKNRISQGQTLMSMVKQLQAENQALKQTLDIAKSDIDDMSIGNAGGREVATKNVDDMKEGKTNYQQALADASIPSMESVPSL